MIDFDVVMVNYNSTAHLLKSLHSIHSEGGLVPSHIFVQDNASWDEINTVHFHFPTAHVSRNTRNLGFSRAVNQALKKTTGEYIALLNPDTTIANGFFESSLKFMEVNPRVGILGPRILDQDGGIQDSARTFPTPLTTFFGRSSWFSRHFPNNPITRRNLVNKRSDGHTPMEVDWVSGACMVVRRKAIQAVGPMDERFFMYWEDADWCRRMWDHGWRVVYYPQASIYHYGGKSSDQNRYRSAVEFHKSAYRLYSKYAVSSLGKPFALIGLAVHLVFVLLMKKLQRG